jgi:hypothetical protein
MRGGALCPTRHFAPVAIAVLLQSCATVASGPYGVSIDGTKAATTTDAAPGGPLRISAGELPELASAYFGVVEVTFENQSAVWIQINEVALDFGSADKNRSVQVTRGSDIDSWERAIMQRSSVSPGGDRAARELLGLGVELWQSDRPGAATVGTLQALDRGETSAESAEASDSADRFPPRHLMAVPFRIPPGLFAKRWVLLYTAAHPLGGCIDFMILDYQTAGAAGARERVLLNFKLNGSSWQASVCASTHPPNAAPPF